MFYILRIGVALQGKNRQLHAHSPALAAIRKLVGYLTGERKRERLFEKRPCFPNREAEISSVKFVEVLRSAQLCQGERRFTACQNDQMQCRREMVKQCRQRLVN